MSYKIICRTDYSEGREYLNYEVIYSGWIKLRQGAGLGALVYSHKFKGAQ